jgi:hypothetical protein
MNWRTIAKRYRSLAPFEAAESGAARVRFEVDRRRRRARHRAHSSPVSSEVQPTVGALLRDGVAVVPQALDVAQLQRLRAELEDRLDTGRDVNPASNDAARPAGDLREASDFLDAADLAQGQDHCRQLTNFVSVHDPLVSCPASVPIAFTDLFVDIATGYLDCLPALGGLNLRKSFVNGLPDFDTLHFHSDPNSPKFLKFFAYLNDVDLEGGPFCYVQGSHREKFRGWRAKYRWTPEEITAIYGEQRLRYLTARLGDLVIADTTGFHRGTKVRSADRAMLTVDFVVHPEFGGRPPQPRMLASDFAALSPRQQAVADIVDLAPSPANDR